MSALLPFLNSPTTQTTVSVRATRSATASSRAARSSRPRRRASSVAAATIVGDAAVGSGDRAAPERSRRLAAARARSSSGRVYPPGIARGWHARLGDQPPGDRGEESMAYSLGIDLGTTYSAAATARGDRLEIFQLGERAATIPSIVVLRADGEVLTGDAAERRALAEPTRTAPRVQAPPRRPDADHPGRHAVRRRGAARPPAAGDRRPGHRAARRPARTRSLCDPPGELRRVQDRPAPSRPIRQADIANVTLLTEPEAAAVHYARQERVPAGAVIAVYDFGGGTFDATILRKTETGFEQLGRPEGMERLGGIDFDEALFTQRRWPWSGRPASRSTPNDPATLAAHRPPARGVPAGQGGALVRHRRDDPGLPARPPDRDAPDPRGVRGDDPAADPRDDRGARAGGQERGSRVRRRRPRSSWSAAARGSRSSPRWSARRPADRSRSTRIPKHTMALGAALVAEPRRRARPASGRRPRPVPARSRPRAGLAAAAGVASGADAGCRRACRRSASQRAPVPRAATGAVPRRRPAPRSGGRRPSRPPVRRRPTPPVAVGAATGVTPPPAAGTVAAPTACRSIGRGDRRRRWRSPSWSVLASAASGMLSGGGAVAESAQRRSPSSPSRRRWRPRSPSPSPHGRADRRTDPVPTPTAGSDADADPGRSPGPDQRDHAQRRTLRRRLRGLRLHAGRCPAGTSTSSSTRSRRRRPGCPATGPWFLYAGPIPFKGYKVSDRPAGANQMCILVANADHSVDPEHRQLRGPARSARRGRDDRARAIWPTEVRRIADEARRVARGDRPGGRGRTRDAAARRAAPGRHRRPGQGRQVDAAQRAGRRAPGGDRRRRVHADRDLVPPRPRLPGDRRAPAGGHARPAVPARGRRARRSTSATSTIDAIERIEVGWPSAKLADLTLIDTPGPRARPTEGTSERTERGAARRRRRGARRGRRRPLPDAPPAPLRRRSSSRRSSIARSPTPRRSTRSSSCRGPTRSARPGRTRSTRRARSPPATPPTAASASSPPGSCPVAGLIAETGATLREEQFGWLRDDRRAAGGAGATTCCCRSTGSATRTGTRSARRSARSCWRGSACSACGSRCGCSADGDGRDVDRAVGRAARAVRDPRAPAHARPSATPARAQALKARSALAALRVDRPRSSTGAASPARRTSSCRSTGSRRRRRTSRCSGCCTSC